MVDPFAAPDPARAKRLNMELMILQSDLKKKQGLKAEAEVQTRRLKDNIRRLEMELGAQDGVFKKIEKDVFVIEQEIAHTKKALREASGK